jgi:hypothetical protein
VYTANDILVNFLGVDYDIDMLSLDIIKKLLEKEKLIREGSNIKISDNYVYTANDILVNFLGVDYEK